MKVFIAGGSGYIGRVLVRQLSLAGHECWVLCRNPESERQRLADEKNIYPEVEVIPITKINEAFERTINKDVRYRFVIDMSTL